MYKSVLGHRNTIPLDVAIEKGLGGGQKRLQVTHLCKSCYKSSSCLVGVILLGTSGPPSWRFCPRTDTTSSTLSRASKNGIRSNSSVSSGSSNHDVTGTWRYQYRTGFILESDTLGQTQCPILLCRYSYNGFSVCGISECKMGMESLYGMGMGSLEWNDLVCKMKMDLSGMGSVCAIDSLQCLCEMGGACMHDATDRIVWVEYVRLWRVVNDDHLSQVTTQSVQVLEEEEFDELSILYSCHCYPTVYFQLP